MAYSEVAANNALKAANDVLYMVEGKFENRFAVAAQFILEKGWEWWNNPHGDFNPGNVTNGRVEDGFPSFPDLVEGLKGYANVLEKTSFDGGDTLVYQNVLDAMRNGSNDDVLNALCDSPYCAPPYSYGNLFNIMEKIGGVEQMAIPGTQETKVDSDDGMYTVVRGDCLWSIAQKEFGDGRQWTRIAEMNPQIHGTTIYEGERIRIR